jgi:hypothetical protein
MALRRFLTASAVVAGIALLPGVAGAAVSATTGAVAPVPAPASLADGASTSNATISVITERSVTFTGPVAAALSTIYSWNGTSWAAGAPSGMNGLCVASHLLHYDRASGKGALSGTVRFSQHIIGILPVQPLLDVTDQVLGAPGTTYATHEATRGLELAAIVPGHDVLGRPQADTLAITAQTSTLHLVTDRLDEVRVLTLCDPPVVPEVSSAFLLPLTALAVAGIAVAAGRRRKRPRLA